MLLKHFVAATLEEAHLRTPVDPFALAWALELAPIHRAGATGVLTGSEIVLDARAPMKRRREVVLRACAERVLALGGYELTSGAVESVAHHLVAAESSAA